ncbi:unnamed protein product [Schistocephalus solidus]|uniref:Uncharacterized protein n=1 Tax=Schistocephalus solidus TaxID=70667 RepID=A0A183SED3_SCHSO|nr:unnamed protein product [Schistocephalus solidus]
MHMLGGRKKPQDEEDVIVANSLETSHLLTPTTKQWARLKDDDEEEEEEEEVDFRREDPTQKADAKSPGRWMITPEMTPTSRPISCEGSRQEA